MVGHSNFVFISVMYFSLVLENKVKKNMTMRVMMQALRTLTKQLTKDGQTKDVREEVGYRDYKSASAKTVLFWIGTFLKITR